MPVSPHSADVCLKFTKADCCMLENKMLHLRTAQMGTSGKYRSTPDARRPKKKKKKKKSGLKSGKV